MRRRSHPLLAGLALLLAGLVIPWSGSADPGAAQPSAADVREARKPVTQPWALGA